MRPLKRSATPPSPQLIKHSSDVVSRWQRRNGWMPLCSHATINLHSPVTVTVTVPVPLIMQHPSDHAACNVNVNVPRRHDSGHTDTDTDTCICAAGPAGRADREDDNDNDRRQRRPRQVDPPVSCPNVLPTQSSEAAVPKTLVGLTDPDIVFLTRTPLIPPIAHSAHHSSPFTLPYTRTDAAGILVTG